MAIGAGVALTAASFVLAEKADDAYDRYSIAVDPEEIQDEYDDAVRYDRFASAALLTGQAAIVLGLYWRLLYRPKSSKSAAGGTSSLTTEEAPPATSPPLRAELIADPLPLRVGVRLHF